MREKPKTCCNCAAQSLIYPYVCPDCLHKLKKLEEDNAFLIGMLNTAAQMLRNKGCQEEAKSIECIAKARVNGND